VTRERFLIALDELQPSQLYLSAAKLSSVEGGWQPPTLEAMPSLPIHPLDGHLILTDGHHRAFAAYREGFTRVPVYWDEDELDWDAYRICVGWCLKEGIRTVAALGERIVPQADYEVLWLWRCRQMHAKLDRRRATPSDSRTPGA
jgi:hypothetical protein